MPKETPKKSAAKAEAADPRFFPVVKAFPPKTGVSLMENATGVMRGLMLNGKSFGMSTHGRYILKLNEERAGELVASKIGKPFSPSAGKTMKGWLEVTSPKADWVALAKEAYAIASAAKPAAKKKKAAPKANKKGS